VLLGHTHTHEFGTGPTTDQVGNPWGLSRSAGGSSGGSAAALAARMVPAATGTDTGGSLRFPAALCGVSTIKPTRGLVPTTGIIPVAPSLDHAGPMARTVGDCAALLEAMAGRPLPKRPRTGPRPLAGLTVAVTDRLPGDTLGSDVALGFERARVALERLGARVIALAAPASAGVGEAGYAAIFNTELWAYHQRYADRAGLYRPAIAALVRSAAGQAGAGYPEALTARDQVSSIWTRWFTDQGVGLILEPTAPAVALARGSGYQAGPPELAALLPFTALWNATGFPVVSLPAGVGSASRLPVGVSLIGPPLADARVIRAAIELQERALRPPRLGTRLEG
jgi:aspartyl-tRNA(Asn)/glutamyl-tRNA(Gln) amidotransferase subunit A